MEVLLAFVGGVIVGAVLGVILMCVLHINGDK